jgi:hypothetical protein
VGEKDGGEEMRSSRDTYGIKTLRIGQARFVANATKAMFRMCFSQYYKRHEWVRHKAFSAVVVDGGLEVSRVM